MEKKIEVKVFNGHEVRLKWDSKSEDYLYAIEDIIALITGRESPDEYWSKIKEIEKEHGVDLSYVCCTLEMPNLDCDSEDIDMADCVGILRIIQSIPSPKVDSIREWLAGTGSKCVDEFFDPDILLENAIEGLKKQGLSEDLISKKVDDAIKMSK